MKLIIFLSFVILLFLFWLYIMKRRTDALEEKVIYTTKRISIQLNAYFRALNALLDLAVEDSGEVFSSMRTNLLTKHNQITGASNVEDIMSEESLLMQTFSEFVTASIQCNNLTKNTNYKYCTEVIGKCQEMVRISHLLYNESVWNLNVELKKAIFFIPSVILGLKEHSYIGEI